MITFKTPDGQKTPGLAAVPLGRSGCAFLHSSIDVGETTALRDKPAQCSGCGCSALIALWPSAARAAALANIDEGTK